MKNKILVKWLQSPSKGTVNCINVNHVPRLATFVTTRRSRITTTTIPKRTFYFPLKCTMARFTVVVISNKLGRLCTRVYSTRTVTSCIGPYVISVAVSSIRDGKSISIMLVNGTATVKGSTGMIIPQLSNYHDTLDYSIISSQMYNEWH